MNLSLKKLAITEHKQADLHRLTEQAINAQFEVEQLEAVVDSLESKLVEFAAFLSEADASKATALVNRDLARNVSNQVRKLNQNSQIVASQTATANTSVNKAATQLSSLINQLTFSSQLIDRLIQCVNKKKALNPLISNELISVLNKAGADASTAVAATLTALESCYATEASGKEAIQISLVELKQSHELLQLLTGDGNGKSADIPGMAIQDASDQVPVVKAAATDAENARADMETALNALSDADSEVLTAQQQVEKLQEDIATENARIKRETGNVTKTGDNLALAEHNLSVAKNRDQKLHEAFESAEEHLRDAGPNDNLEILRNAVEIAIAKHEENVALRMKASAEIDQYRAEQSTAEERLKVAQKSVGDIGKELPPKQTALKSANEAEATARAALKTANQKLDVKNATLTKESAKFDALIKDTTGAASLSTLLESAYQNSLVKYSTALTAQQQVSKQLDQAQTRLAKAQNSLASLTAGLDAATAAALAA